MRGNFVGLGLAIATGLSLVAGLSCGEPGSATSAAHGGAVRLPLPATKGGMSLTEALSRRRSVRDFRDDPLTAEQIGQLLWAAQGITEPGRGLRTAPSAGALYPLQVYVVKSDGAFRYEPESHALTALTPRDLRRSLAEAALNQASVAAAPVDFLISGDYSVTAAKYGPRAERYVHLEAGHAAQNLLLQATALGLGAVPVGAFRDDAVAKVLGLPQAETPLYVIPVGHPAG